MARRVLILSDIRLLLTPRIHTEISSSLKESHQVRTLKYYIYILRNSYSTVFLKPKIDTKRRTQTSHVMPRSSGNEEHIAWDQNALSKLSS